MIRRFMPILVLLAVLTGASLALAQQAPLDTSPGNSDLILSWRSNGFAPSGYEGRVAAAGGGTVLLTAEALVGGRPADISKYDVRWYVNDDFYTSGLGLQAITVPIQAYHQDSIDVRVEIFGAPFAASDASMSVPLTDPLAVIEQHSGVSLRSGKNIFEAIPYSFNVKDPNNLLYTWAVNEDVPQSSENPRSLVLSIEGSPYGSVDLRLTISHPENDSESSAASLRVGAPVAVPIQ